jgi:hypothetical protein
MSHAVSPLRTLVHTVSKNHHGNSTSGAHATGSPVLGSAKTTQLLRSARTGLGNLRQVHLRTASPVGRQGVEPTVEGIPKLPLQSSRWPTAARDRLVVKAVQRRGWLAQWGVRWQRHARGRRRCYTCPCITRNASNESHGPIRTEVPARSCAKPIVRRRPEVAPGIALDVDARPRPPR